MAVQIFSSSTTHQHRYGLVSGSKDCQWQEGINRESFKEEDKYMGLEMEL